MPETDNNAKSSAVDAGATGGAGESGSGAVSSCPYAEPGLDIDHICDGELKPANPSNPDSTSKIASGFHSTQSPDDTKEKRDEAPAETDTPPPSKVVVPLEDPDIDDKGSYRATVFIHDASKGNGAGGWRKKKSSMFPDDWSKEKVAAEIQEAYKTASDAGELEDQPSGKKLFTSANASGITVQGFYNPDTDRIETGYPVDPSA